MFTCKHARSVWLHSGFLFNLISASGLKPEEFLFHLSQVHNKSELEIIFCIMWFIWYDQNNILHGHSAVGVPSPGVADLSTSTGVVQSATGAHSYSTGVKASHLVGVAAPIKWQPPPVHCLKMNIDAAFDSSQKRIGLGIIIRDSSGCFNAAKSKLVRGCYRPQEMEAKAMFYGLIFARSLNL
uniref:RNase H type-1 domain-containing protein n=1 Tax=Cannabis sativa TaxID=3483 RepID=A0A803QE55_CANSA